MGFWGGQNPPQKSGAGVVLGGDNGGCRTANVPWRWTRIRKEFWADHLCRHRPVPLLPVKEDSIGSYINKKKPDIVLINNFKPHIHHLHRNWQSGTLITCSFVLSRQGNTYLKEQQTKP
jgi:hypothetical protein